MNYAIIRIQGKQYRVSEGQTLTLDRIKGKEKDKIVFEDVLLVCEKEKFLIGQPNLVKVKVEGEIIKHFRGTKIRIEKFRAKSRYRRVKGHRQERTEVKVTKIRTS